MPLKVKGDKDNELRKSRSERSKVTKPAWCKGGCSTHSPGAKSINQKNKITNNLNSNKMKTYKNVQVNSANVLSYRQLIQKVKAHLSQFYPELKGENQTIVADLMVRNDEDVFENNGQFACYSSKLEREKPEQKKKRTMYNPGEFFVWNTWSWTIKEPSDQKAQDSKEQTYKCIRIDKDFPITPFTESAITKAFENMIADVQRREKSATEEGGQA